VRGGSYSIYKSPLVVQIVSFLQSSALKFLHTKYQILVARSVWKMGCRAVRRDINC